MERLSLDDFKAKSSNSQELEGLTGGILGACHCAICDKWDQAPHGTGAGLNKLIHILFDDDHVE